MISRPQAWLLVYQSRSRGGQPTGIALVRTVAATPARVAAPPARGPRPVRPPEVGPARSRAAPLPAPRLPVRASRARASRAKPEPTAARRPAERRSVAPAEPPMERPNAAPHLAAQARWASAAAPQACRLGRGGTPAVVCLSLKQPQDQPASWAERRGRRRRTTALVVVHTRETRGESVTARRREHWRRRTGRAEWLRRDVADTPAAPRRAAP